MSSVASGISSLSGSLAMSGVFSSINTDLLISRQMSINSIPLTNLQQRKAAIASQEAALVDLSTQLKSMQDIADKLRNSSTLGGTTASVSDSTILSATSNGGAISGSHTVTVGRLATPKKQVHAGLAAEDTKVGAGAFSYTYKAGQSDAVTRTLYTTADTTLTDLTNLINNDAGNPGVTASVLRYDDGSGNAYHLVLSGKDSGSTFNTLVNDAGTTLDGTNGTVDLRQASFLETQQAQDAQVRVDGYPAEPNWITRGSNTISDVIPGVTLTLNKLGATNVSVQQDTAQLKSDIQSLVSAYNALVDKFQQYAGYNSATKSSGVLQGDSVTNNMQYLVRAQLTGAAGGFAVGANMFTSPADIGITVDKTGKLALDETKLDTALDKDYQGVLDLIGAQRKGVSSDTHIQFSSAASTTASGTYEVQVDLTNGSPSAARIRKSGETQWRDADINGTRISGKVGNPEQGLSLTAIWDGSSATQSATVRVEQGFAGAVYDRVQSILDPVTGTMTSKKAQYDAALEQLAKSIATEQTRLDKLQAALKAKYARMEEALAQLDAFRAAYASLTGDTSSSTKSSSSSSSSSSPASVSSS